MDNRFHYMAVTDERQRYMPLPDDRAPGRGQPLAYPEAVLLVNPVEPELKGQVTTSHSDMTSKGFSYYIIYLKAHFCVCVLTLSLYFAGVSL